jgi:hypothetical protein
MPSGVVRFDCFFFSLVIPDFWSVKNLPGTLTEEDVMGLFCVKSMKWSPCALVNLCSGEGLASASSIGKARLGRATFGSTSVLLFTAGKQAGRDKTREQVWHAPRLLSHILHKDCLGLIYTVYKRFIVYYQILPTCQQLQWIAMATAANTSVWFVVLRFVASARDAYFTCS